MPFILIKGTFHVVGYAPDGDSIRFKADNAAHWEKIDGTPKHNKKDHIQLRFEGIDALETHYRPRNKGAKDHHQPLAYAQGARSFMLATLGIENVVWGEKGKEVVSADDGVKGYILTRQVDNPKYGRPVSFVFAGEANEQGGSEVMLKPIRVRQSANYKLLAAGHAYPTYYQTLFSDLREELTRAVKRARNANAKRGLWKADKTGGLNFNGLASITDAHPILPKLFRRLVEHIESGGQLSTFRQFLHDKGDGLLILPQANHTSALDAVVTVKGKRISLTVAPENLVFDPQG